VLAATTPEQVPEVIAEAERLAVRGACHVVGSVSYEAGRAFGLAVRHEDPSLVPLAWFAAFDEGLPSRVARRSAARDPAVFTVGLLAPSMDRETFERAYAAIRAHLAAGDSYQVNVTFALEGTFDGDPAGLFDELVRRQQGSYSCFVETPEWAICSASPELFFERRATTLRMRPMKGTAARGLWPADDEAAREALRGSAKQQAENVMIVDMVRNDLGRVARLGSVCVPSLFDVERYPTLWQMTSTVTAESGASLAEIFAVLHPSASVTGAPKKRTMELIARLESEPRGVYTGAIGYIAPGGDARFNVAIRTAVIDRSRGRLRYGVGSGIVWDSREDAEYDECLLKGRVLTEAASAGVAGMAGVFDDFELLETLRWTPEQGFWLRERHLARLAASAAYFGMPCDRAQVARALDEGVRGETAARRVRLLLDRGGRVRVEHRPMPPTETLRVALARRPVDSRDLFLYHKTTRRQVYEGAMVPGADDVILWNERGEVTESTVGSVVCEMDGGRVTPPVRCGLLPGTYREALLVEGMVKEGVVLVDDLRRIGWCWVVNSVHGWRRAVLFGDQTERGDRTSRGAAMAPAADS